MALPPSSSVSLQTIADQLGVSKTTVHHALLGTGRVSAERRTEILDLAYSLHYRPNALARSLSVRRTGFLGALVCSLGSEWDAHLAEGIETTASAEGLSVLLGCSHYHAEREHDLLEKFLENRADGLIVLPSGDPARRDYYRRLLQEGVSLVFVVRTPEGLTADAVLPDYFRGGYLVGRHLARLGCRRVGYLAAPDHPAPVSTRREGCREALRDTGPTQFVDIPIVKAWGEDGPAQAYATLREFLQAGEQLDGLFVFNDRMALAAIRALRDSGLRVPEDVAVVGFDDHPQAALAEIPLTTIHVDMQEIGAAAARLLLSRLRGEIADPEPRQLTVEPSLVVRQSCGGA